MKLKVLLEETKNIENEYKKYIMKMQNDGYSSESLKRLVQLANESSEKEFYDRINGMIANIPLYARNFDMLDAFYTIQKYDKKGEIERVIKLIWEIPKNVKESKAEIERLKKTSKKLPMKKLRLKK